MDNSEQLVAAMQNVSDIDALLNAKTLDDINALEKHITQFSLICKLNETQIIFAHSDKNERLFELGTIQPNKALKFVKLDDAFEKELDITTQIELLYSKDNEVLLREKTWFSEYTVISDAETSTMFARGLMDRYGIESLVYELHSNWIEGLNKRPLSDDWLLLGHQLCEVFDRYFKEINVK